MNLFYIANFVKTMEPGDEVRIICDEPGKVTILARKNERKWDVSTMQVNDKSIIVGP